MMTIKRYSQDDKDSWNDFIRCSRTPMFMFNRGYMDYHSDRFCDNSLMFYDDDELVAVLPASLHGVEIRSHGGLTYGGMIVGSKIKQHTMMDCFTVLKQYCFSNGVESLVYKSIPYIFDNQPVQEDLYALFINGARIMKVEPSTVVNLKKPFKMPKGRKAQISRARREGVVVQKVGDFASFIELENEVLQQHHGTKAVHTSEEIELLNSRFPENILCIGGYLNDQMIAGALVFVYDSVVHTQYLAANDVARGIGALDLVVNEIINEYKDVKQYLDFGISTENNGQFLNEGLISQKEGFGGRTVAYTTYLLNIG